MNYNFIRVPTIALPPAGGKPLLYGQRLALLRAKFAYRSAPHLLTFLARKSLHTIYNAPKLGTHYSKKWCKVTDFLPNNMFYMLSFFDKAPEKIDI